MHQVLTTEHRSHYLLDRFDTAAGGYITVRFGALDPGLWPETSASNRNSVEERAFRSCRA
jgi:hypothetical protein